MFRLSYDIGRLLSLASSSLALLALPQTDAPEVPLSQGDEQSGQFVAEVGQYFETLDGIQMALRSSLAHIRSARISSAVLTAPLARASGSTSHHHPLHIHIHIHPHPLLPPPPPDTTIGASAGAGNEGNAKTEEKTRGLLEGRVERDG
ncbi:hypothetical protein BJV78DRAFT_1158204 [Lactifluus subvellereus]|nr:hypothetical protein BJV78DRAFT_1158204 [Lactifluus subvellereus]